MDIVVRVLPTLSSVILVWVTFFLLLVLLRFLLYKPVSKFLQDRKDRIQSDIEEAQVLKEEASQLKTNYELRIQKSKDEGQKIIEGARLRAEELTQDILADARQEAEVVLSRAKKEIERQKEIAYAEMKAQSGEMAILIASKIMEESITYDSQKNLIDKFIDEVGNAQWPS